MVINTNKGIIKLITLAERNEIWDRTAIIITKKKIIDRDAMFG